MIKRTKYKYVNKNVNIFQVRIIRFELAIAAI